MSNRLGSALSHIGLGATNLCVEFPSLAGPVRVTKSLSFEIPKGGTLGIVGESGSGKSMSIRALCGLVPEPGRVTSGSVTVGGRCVESDFAQFRGKQISMIFQDPGRSLNPVMTVGQQLQEAVRIGRRVSRSDARLISIDLLESVNIANARGRMESYPHQLSGGMRQRVMIGLALACEPQILLADEPTTALDVSTQAQVLRLLKSLQAQHGMTIVLVSHDMGVVSEMCEEVLVMYGGSVVERGTAQRIVSSPSHPYTKGLLAAVPGLRPGKLAEAIAGQPPEISNLPPGCPFQNRCQYVRNSCAEIDMIQESKKLCACPYAELNVGS